MIKKIYLIIIMIHIISISLISQQNIKNIAVISRIKSNKILLRWAPDNPIAWQYLNSYGYLLERYTLYRDGQFIDNPRSTQVQLGKVKPWEKSKFESVIDTNDRVAIVAQAIYGESFNVEAQSAAQNLINRAEELQNRYTFCLLAAGQSLLAADAAGLYYCDTKVKKGEKYVYRIIPLVPDTLEKIDTGYVYVGLDDWQPLPKPLLLSIYTDGNSVTLKWDKKHFDRIYLYYQIERSIDGVNFEQINTLPYLNPSPKPENEDYYLRIDTLPNYNVKYYYRIKGVSLFEEVSPPSDILSAIAIQKLNVQPIIKQAITGQSSIKIIWEFPTELRYQLKGFQVYKGSSIQNISSPLSDELLSPSDSEIVDYSPQTSNYYRVKAIDKQENSTESLPYFVAMEDSIPPVPPKGLSGTIDSSGVVSLKWFRNAEQDIEGYQIFRANYPNEEFLQVSSNIIADTIFNDKINLNNLTTKVYYCLRAVDKHYNSSDYSSILALQKPDIIPPQPPAITEYQINNGLITISFAPSSSLDVKQYVAYRKSTEDTLWKACNVLKGYNSLSFTDTCKYAPCQYSYSLIAIDSSGNESSNSNILSIEINRPFDNHEIEKFTFYAIKNYEKKQIELYWDYLPASAARYIIYRSVNSGPYRTISSFDSGSGKYVDINVKPGCNYEYQIINQSIKIKKNNSLSVAF
jgi:hypothetical protein